MLFSRTLTRLQRCRQIDTLHSTLLAAMMALFGACAFSACAGEPEEPRPVPDATKAGGPESKPSGGTDSAPRAIANESIRRIDENHFEIRHDAWNALPSLAHSDKRIRLVPMYASGKQIGFKLFVIQPGSLPDRLGFRNGDTIREINGLATLRLEDFLMVYNDNQNRSDITVVLTRKGRKITLRYRIV